MSQSTLHESGSSNSPLKTRLISWSVTAMRVSQGWLLALDQILRGETTRPSALREQALQIPLAGLSLLILALAIGYGFCMGMYPGCRIEGPSGLQWLACTLKIPALFVLTLCVTFPSLYVVNALVGSRLQLMAVLQLLVAALAVNLAVLASAGPIVAFFSFSTTNSDFICLLNVLVFAVSGLLGMVFLLQTLHRLSTIPSTLTRCLGRKRDPMPGGPIGPGETNVAGLSPAMAQSWEHDRWLSDPKGPRPAISPTTEAIVEREDDPCALDPLEGRVLGRHVKTVFCCWTVIFSVVGAQMAWVLRPYFGNADPNLPFVWFGPRSSNFFEGVWTALHQLLR